MKKKIIVALDTADLQHALTLAQQLQPHVAGLKVGLEFFSSHGIAGVARIKALQTPVFLDLKLHDIPNTVAHAVQALVQLKCTWLTVHASGGLAMLQAAQKAAVATAEKHNLPAPKLLAVTVLTSMKEAELQDIGVTNSCSEQVLRLADIAVTAGLTGIVCSPHEITAIRQHFGDALEIITPGIRPQGAALHDQNRVMTPKQALDLGANYLVIGRAITEAADPIAAINTINAAL